MNDNELVIRKLDTRTNTYVPISGGVESAWALCYALNNPDMIPIGAHWYDIIYGKTYADASMFYARKQCEYLGIPFIWDESRGQSDIMGYEKTVPVVYSGMSAFMSLWLGQPRGIKFKWFLSGANAEDDMRTSLFFRPYRKLMALGQSEALDGTDLKWSEFYKTPEIICPGDFLTKAEMLGMIMAHDPKLLELIWTCTKPKGVLKKDGDITDYVPCNKCNKCLEYKNAREMAQEASVRWSEHIEYYARWHRHQRKMDNIQKEYEDD